MNNSTKVIFEKSIKGMTGISLTDEELSLDFIRPQFLRKEPAVLPEVSELEAMRHFKELSDKILCRIRLLSSWFLYNEIQPKSQ